MRSSLALFAASVLTAFFTGTSDAGAPPNSIGPAYIADALFGINYERSISPLFCVDALAATSGRIDFGGLRLVLSRDEPSFQVRPSLGMCMVRGRPDDEDADSNSPWFGFVWPAIGFGERFGRISATEDIGLIYGNTGEEDNAYPALSAALMYMF